MSSDGIDALSPEPLLPDADADAVSSPALALPRGAELDGYLRRSLGQQERAIGLAYAAERVRTWPYTLVAILGFAGWLLLFPLANSQIVPLWLGCLLSCVYIPVGYVIAHEAMHSNLGRPGTRHRFWNELTGQISTIPLILPFSMLKQMHLLHHRFVNDPDKDPDVIYAAPNLGMALVKSWLSRQPGKGGAAARWRRHIAELGTAEARRALAETMALHIATMALFFIMAWRGFAIELALLWWLPRHIGLSYMHTVLNWAVHHPHDRTGRYDNAPITRLPLGYVLSMGMDYHLVHHLYPHIPIHATRAAYNQIKPLLELRGVDCSAH